MRCEGRRNKSVQEKQLLLFDLDGTLTDPAEGITRSVQYALRSFGIEVEDLTTLYPFIGPPLQDSFQRFLGFSEEKARLAVTRYREYFAAEGIFENRVYPGIPALLAGLKDRGKELVLATSKPTVFAERILEHFQLSSYFTYISGSFLDGRRSDKREVVLHALEHGHVQERSRAVMVGDREYDVFGAAGAGVDCIGVAYGYGSRAELEEAGATVVSDTVEELRALLIGEAAE
ncbi:MAG: HAD family hydrolase [Clostridiales bacterium]|nr:HAD family hydrolase [Clostridiales bacterium]